MLGTRPCSFSTCQPNHFKCIGAWKLETKTTKKKLSYNEVSSLNDEYPTGNVLIRVGILTGNLKGGKIEGVASERHTFRHELEQDRLKKVERSSCLGKDFPLIN